MWYLILFWKLLSRFFPLFKQHVTVGGANEFVAFKKQLIVLLVYVCWRYQKKIGSYDKQLWEKTLEQKIIRGLTHIQMKSAKPKTDLIDLDLVRGSSFTKAKPKHGFITVARHATLRLIFLPLYAKWWVRQTSGKIFALFLLIYLSELVNIAIYSFNTARLPAESLTVPSTEIVVPIVMMWVLSVIHSEIVATNPGPEQKSTQVQNKRSYKKRRSKTKRSTLATKRVVQEKTVVIEEKEGGDAIEHVAANTSDSDSQRSGGNRLAPTVEKYDDGFESLNGNGSSPSDNFEDVATSTPTEARTSQNLKCDAWVRSLCEKTTGKLSRQQSAPVLFRDSSGAESDDESNLKAPQKLSIRRNSQIPIVNIIDSTCDTEDDAFSSPGTDFPLYADATTSATDWCGVTTNSEDCSYSSEYETDSNIETSQHLEFDLTPSAILSPCCSASDRVSCTIWECNEIKKADLSVFDISSAIISKVEMMPQSMDYFYVGVVISTLLAVLPALFRFCNSCVDSSTLLNNDTSNFIAVTTPELSLSQLSDIFHIVVEGAFGSAWWERTVILIASLQRWVLASAFFFLLAVAERTFKQRFLYAKLFAHLTSARRAKKSDLPHFRLNKVRNIKTWLSVRSYLRKRGLQRSVDVIVSAAFIITLLLLSFLSVELLKDTVGLHSQYNLEAMIWCFGLGILLLRFMTLGTEINKKYRNLSLLITEQINLYLQIEQKPEKKNELMVANSVLKLAADLLKELESPFKISGLSANPYLYNITKVVILSALSGVLSDMLGFKLKLHKIKVK